MHYTFPLSPSISLTTCLFSDWCVLDIETPRRRDAGMSRTPHTCLMTKVTFELPVSRHPVIQNPCLLSDWCLLDIETPGRRDVKSKLMVSHLGSTTFNESDAKTAWGSWACKLQEDSLAESQCLLQEKSRPPWLNRLLRSHKLEAHDELDVLGFLHHCGRHWSHNAVVCCTGS